MPEIDVEDVQSKIAEIFEQVFAAYGHQIFEEQAAKAIASDYRLPYIGRADQSDLKRS